MPSGHLDRTGTHLIEGSSTPPYRAFDAAILVGLLIAGLALFGQEPVYAQPLATDELDCGGDAFSNAEVVEKRPARQGPLTAVPQTLCADLAPQHPPANISIGVYPTLLPRNGATGPSAPYEGWPDGTGRAPRP